MGAFLSILCTGILCTTCYYSCKKKHGSLSGGFAVMANGHGGIGRGLANGSLRNRKAGGGSAKYTRLNTDEENAIELRSEIFLANLSHF